MGEQPNRRDFLQASAAGLAAAGLVGADEPVRKNEGGIPVRKFGRTEEQLSLIGLGGHAATTPEKMDEKASLRLIQRAVDEGITFMDNAWDYHDGLAEERMGKALAEGKLRDKVFLMTKVCGRTAKDARGSRRIASGMIQPAWLAPKYPQRRESIARATHRIPCPLACA